MYLKLIVLTIIIACFIYTEYRLRNINEHFSNKENKKLNIKKTLNFKKVYNNNNFTVWEPEPIDDYFPINQSITMNNKKPQEPGILVKSTNKMLDRPKDYLLIASTEDNIGIWKPLSYEGYKEMGHIFSKEKPSKHRFRCINDEYTKLSSIDNNICSKNLDSNKNNGNEGYTVWYITDSENFMCSSLNESSIPKDLAYKLNKTYLSAEKKLKIKKTKKFIKVWSYSNLETTKDVTIWKPLSEKDYVNVSFIVLPGKVNPNDNLETVLVHKDFVKAPIDFGNKSIVEFKLKTPVNKQNSISFWRPIPPKGYVCLSDVAVLGNEEPNLNNIIYCLPLEYTENIENNLTEVWSSIPNTKNKLSLFKNNNSYLFSNDKYIKPNLTTYKINSKLIEIEKDLLDLDREIILNYKLNNNNSEILDSEKREYLLLKTLSNRLGINTNRLTDVSFSENSNKISIMLTSKPINSNQQKTYDIYKQLDDLINNNNGLKINNSNDDNHIMTIINIKLIEPTDLKSIPIDNRNFSDKYN